MAVYSNVGCICIIQVALIATFNSQFALSLCIFLHGATVVEQRDAFVRLKPSATGFSSLQGQIFRDSCSEVDAFSQPTFRASIQLR